MTAGQRASTSVPFPWCAAGTLSGDESQYSRRTIIVPSDVDEVFANVCDDGLPEVARWRDPQGRFWKRFELPCANWAAEGEKTATAELTLSGNSLAVRQATALLAPALPRPAIDIAEGNQAAEDTHDERLPEYTYEPRLFTKKGGVAA